jgi:hypothetical protein
VALTTYSDIQEAISRTLQRDDLAGQIPDFILYAEARLNNILRVAQMQASATITLTAGTGSLPTDYLSWIRVYSNSSPVYDLQNVDPAWAIEKYPDTASGTPAYFYIAGSSIFTKPVSSSNVIMLYNQKIPALASNISGNWITSRDPRLYLYAACLEAAPHIDDDARITTWGKMLEIAVNELHQSDTGHRWGRVASRIRGPVA